MNDSIQNLHYKIKKEVSVEMVRENLIEWRYPGILTITRRARAFRLHQESKSRLVIFLQDMK